jgi:hypothetical protein
MSMPVKHQGTRLKFRSGGLHTSVRSRNLEFCLWHYRFVSFGNPEGAGGTLTVFHECVRSWQFLTPW